MISYDHGCRAGNGSQLVVDMKPAIGTETGTMTFVINKQLENCGEGWEFSNHDSVYISVYTEQLSMLVDVLEGRAEKLRNGHGIRIRDMEGCLSTLHLDLITDPYHGYAMHIQNKHANGDKLDGRIVLSVCEGNNLKDIIKSSFSRLAFGD